MKKVGVAILGFGTVGGGTYQILMERRNRIKEEYGVDIAVKSILVRNTAKAIAQGAPEELITTDFNEIIADSSIDIVAECIGGIEPAKSYLIGALEHGKNIVTANKELFSKYWGELENAAKKTGTGMYFEATCAGGIPIIRTLTQAMQANTVLEIKGIINGTTNYILSRMTNENASYQDVLKDAQDLGFAEADPTADVEGYDASYKLSILSSLAYNRFLPVELIYREGISGIDIEDIKIGKSFGFTIKLLGISKFIDGKIEARVHPVFLKSTHPLAGVSGAFNAIFLVGDNVGDIMLYGKGAGALPTGSAVVSDIVFCARQLEHARYSEISDVIKQGEIIRDFMSDYYLRVTVHDVSGVLAKITAIFAKHNVSITSMRQDSGDGLVQVIFVTHKSTENNMRAAVSDIEALNEVQKVNALIRVEK